MHFIFGKRGENGFGQEKVSLQEGFSSERVLVGWLGEKISTKCWLREKKIERSEKKMSLQEEVFLCAWVGWKTNTP